MKRKQTEIINIELVMTVAMKMKKVYVTDTCILQNVANSTQYKKTVQFT